ncbi:putative ABC transport system permease protein [Clostridium acidisoli DSM 12555]|uniref:Putative ABC transport system permease protein n=1 Tax=Clostridium acidisoli DSM 12555 TaxID=1121291 RepID=A0A1W1XSV3_9CLOT|nr:ABC transporter permease [Clostridium acidisoli]SMC26967.1 putative ABC transport system permease protein [Clostridium acidisoli DSM 12555]
MRVTQLFKIALYSVWSNKVRSFLTMLGIIIGISSVIILVGMGEGTKQTVSEEISSLGTNLITVSLTKTATISNQELTELKTKPGIKEVAPQISSSNVNVKAGSKSSTTTIEASNANYAKIKNYTVSSGRFITDRDVENRYNILVIGTETANNIFGYTNVVGQYMYVNGIEFKIVGVLASEGTSTTGSSDDKIILPLTTAQRLLKTASISTYYVEAESQAKIDTAMSYLKMFLNKKYGLRNLATSTTTNSYYRVLSQTSLLTTATSTTTSMSNMLSGVAAISLLVGGIGIMNIMLVSVIERTKEIGTRKAIGAKRRTILAQFLIEAASVSGLGGLLGVLFGYLGAYIAKTFFSTSIVISSNIVIAAFMFSLLVGLIFGIYPANKASKLNPIEALRFE